MSRVTSLRDGASIVAPVVSYDDGEGAEVWRREYPSVLREYYRAIAALAGVQRCSSGGDGQSRADSIVCDRCGLGAAVGASGESVAVGIVGASSASSLGANNLSFFCVGAGGDGSRVSFDNSCGVDARHEADRGEHVGVARSGVGGTCDIADDVGVFGVSRVDNGRFCGGDGCGELGGNTVGEKTLRNREKRHARRDRRNARRVAGVDTRCRGGNLSWRQGHSFTESMDDEDRVRLRDSRVRRFEAENELATERARRTLELEKAKDLDVQKKRQETKMLRDTEVNKVAIEKAFGILATTGNVPGVGGSVKTVVSDGSAPGLVSGSVSPNSSVSMAEIHAMQKQNLEMERQISELKRKNPELYSEIVCVRAEDEATENTGWTPDCNGNPPVELGQIVPDFMDLELEKDGKYHYREGSSWKYIDY